VEVTSTDFEESHRLGSKTPFFLSTSATIGTVELTGFEMTKTNALGQWAAIPTAISRTIEALMLKRSSRVIPGFLGTPAGMTTMCASLSAFSSPPSAGKYPFTTEGVLMCEISAATPGALTTSYNASSVMRVDCLRSKDSGCPSFRSSASI
jgi:hypothetical protein